MSIQIKDREPFYLLGVMVETSLATAGQDISALEKVYIESEPELITHAITPWHYGLMWYTHDHRYCYLLGVAVEQMLGERNPLLCRHIPAARYAVLEVERDQSLFTAWGDFFDKVLPSAGWAPDYNHRMFFEYYPEDGGGSCQLWTPVLPQVENLS